MRGRESEGSGIAGGMSWLAGDWSTGAGEDLGMSWEEITEGSARERKTKIISDNKNKQTRWKSFTLL